MILHIHVVFNLLKAVKTGYLLMLTSITRLYTGSAVDPSRFFFFKLITGKLHALISTDR